MCRTLYIICRKQTDSHSLPWENNKQVIVLSRKGGQKKGTQKGRTCFSYLFDYQYCQVFEFFLFDISLVLGLKILEDFIICVLHFFIQFGIRIQVGSPTHISHKEGKKVIGFILLFIVVSVERGKVKKSFCWLAFVFVYA